MSTYKIAVHETRLTIILPREEAPSAARAQAYLSNGDIHVRIIAARPGEVGVRGTAVKNMPDLWCFEWGIGAVGEGETLPKTSRAAAQKLGEGHYCLPARNIIEYHKRKHGPRHHEAKRQKKVAPTVHWADVKLAVRTVNEFLAAADGEFEVQLREQGGIRITRLDVAE